MVLPNHKKKPAKAKLVYDEVSAGGFVFREQAGKIYIVLIKDSYGKWTFAKGHLEKGETPAKAALAEVREETGVGSARIVKKLGALSLTVRPLKSGDKTLEKLVHVYLLVTKSPRIMAERSKTIKAVRWFSPSQALKAIKYRDTRKLLLKAIKEFKKQQLLPISHPGRSRGTDRIS